MLGRARLTDEVDRVDVGRVPWTSQHRDRVRTAVDEALPACPGTWQGVVDTAQHVEVELTAAGLDLAAQLWAQHGEVLRLTVAGHPYPLDEVAVAAERRPPGTRATAPWPPELSSRVDVDRATLVQGEDVRGDLVLRATRQPVELASSGLLVGKLLDAQRPVRDTAEVDLQFTGAVVEWRGPAPYWFVVVPDEQCADLREEAASASYGWGVVPVTARLGSVAFTTSLIPRHGGYLLPLKDAVRRPAGVTAGDDVTVELTVRHGGR